MATNLGAAGRSTIDGVLLGGRALSISNEKFLEAVFRGIEPGTHAALVGFPGDPDTNSKWAATGWAPGERLPREIREDHNNYAAISTFRPNAKGERWQRLVSLTDSLRILMIDDVGTGLGSKIGWDKLKLPPSALIETSPDNFQADYFVTQDDDARDRPLCGRLIDALIKNGLRDDGRDTGMAGLNRVARLPVAINGKAKHTKNGRPWQVRCGEFEPARRYTIKQITAAWNLDLTAPPERKRAPFAITADMADRAARHFDSMLRVFQRLSMYKREIRNGWHEVTCPWVDDHTGHSDNGAYLAEPSAENNFEGGFKCHHDGCAEKHIIDVQAWWGDLCCARKKQ